MICRMQSRGIVEQMYRARNRKYKPASASGVGRPWRSVRGSRNIHERGYSHSSSTSEVANFFYSQNRAEMFSERVRWLNGGHA